MLPEASEDVAIVVIGRNEGERLQRCLQSVVEDGRTVVYVDSGSTDGSADYAASLGCRSMELDASLPFTAARARNEGFADVLEDFPDKSFVQFLDGDCELVEGWLAQGVATLKARADVGIVCGHVRELHPLATVYNRLCDLEWQQIPGELRTSGGRFMVRAEVFRAVGGFRAEVIAAEDDEFCVRVRAAGWKIFQVDAEMARHDAAMTRFSQWWRRAERTGHAYAQVSAMHGGGEEKYFVSEYRKVWLWGLALPLAAVLLVPFTRGLSLVVALGAYALQFARIYYRCRKDNWYRCGVRGWKAGDAFVYSFFTVIFKFPALLGLLEYHWRQWRGVAPKIIEYKRS